MSRFVTQKELRDSVTEQEIQDAYAALDTPRWDSIKEVILIDYIDVALTMRKRGIVRRKFDEKTESTEAKQP